jgi:DNA-binding CsgD family transcriptional regulator
MEASARIDISDELERVVAPTLLLQSQSDRQLPAELMRTLVEALPNGRLAQLAGHGASLFADEPDADVGLILDFLLDPSGVELRSGPADADGLTPRELDVLRLIARGETNAEIAHRLGISVHTVERHAVNLYRKIGARGRADATAHAVRRGLV